MLRQKRPTGWIFYLFRCDINLRKPDTYCSGYYFKRDFLRPVCKQPDREGRKGRKPLVNIRRMP